MEMDFMKVGLSHLKEKQRGLHLQVQCNYQCQVCKGEVEGACHAHEAIYKSMTLLWESCVCPKGELDVWHKLECLMGECSHCGFQLFPLCLLELSSIYSFTVKWKCFEYYEVGIDKRTGKPKKRLREAFKDIPVQEFLSYLEKTVCTFITHNFRARW
jgi:hypothetical protein